MNRISLTLYAVAKLFNDKPFYRHVYLLSFTYINRFDEMALIRHLVSQQESIRFEFFWLRLMQRSGSISPKVA